MKCNVESQLISSVNLQSIGKIYGDGHDHGPENEIKSSRIASNRYSPQIEVNVSDLNLDHLQEIQI
jgi:hypothetical protein